MAFVTKWSDVVSDWLTGLVPPVDMGKIMEALLRAAWERLAPSRANGSTVPNTAWPLGRIQDYHYAYPLVTKNNTHDNWHDGKCMATAMAHVEGLIGWHVSSRYINYTLYAGVHPLEGIEVKATSFWTRDTLAQYLGYANWASSPALNKDYQSSSAFPYLEGSAELIDQDKFVNWAIFMYQCLNLLRWKAHYGFSLIDTFYFSWGNLARKWQTKSVIAADFAAAKAAFIAAPWVDNGSIGSLAWFSTAAVTDPTHAQWDCFRPGLFSFISDSDADIRAIKYSVDIYAQSGVVVSPPYNLPIGPIIGDKLSHLTNSYSEAAVKTNLDPQFFLDTDLAAITAQCTTGFNVAFVILCKMDGANGFKFKDW